MYLPFSYQLLYGCYVTLPPLFGLAASLLAQVEFVWTQTRVADDPSLAINPSGRVPFLQLQPAAGSTGLSGLVRSAQACLHGAAACLPSGPPPPL